MATLPPEVTALLERMWQHLYAQVEAMVRREVPKQFGQMFRGGKIDGAHVTIAIPATTSLPATAQNRLGAVYPDGTSVTITPGGEIAAQVDITEGGSGGGWEPGLNFIDGQAIAITAVDNTSAHRVDVTVAADTATTSQIGVVKPDGATIDVAGGVISVPVAYPATGSPGAMAPANGGKLGAVYPDGATIGITLDGELSTIVTTATTTSTGAAGADKVYDVGGGSEPSGWQTVAFSDGAWAASVHNTTEATPLTIPSAVWLSYTAGNVPTSEKWLLRHRFTIGPGTVTSATLKIQADDYVLAVYVNGTFVYGPGVGILAETEVDVALPPSLFTVGGASLVAFEIQNGSTGVGPSALAFALVVSTSTGSASPGESIQHNGTLVDTQPILDFEDPAFAVTDDAANSRVKVSLAAFGASGGSHAAGIVPDPGSSAGATKFLREDATWAVPAGGSSARYEPLCDGSVPALIFADGDVIMVEVS